MLRKTSSLILLALLCASTSLLAATPTHLTVRVLSKDAKFVGTSMGGVEVLVRDAETGELLAQGVTSGSTGDTARIMRTDRQRGMTLSTEGSAKVDLVVDLDEPTLVEISARGPLAQRQSAQRVSLTQWMLPGKDVDTGDGLLLELPGTVVDVLAPATHSAVTGVPAEVSVEVNVTMMCGCPLSPGGLWDSNGFEIRALVSLDGERRADLDFDLAYAGTVSRFAGTLKAPEPGAYDLTVYAFQKATGNTGLDRATVIVVGE
ncbi:MAG: hypothetical protein KDD11_11235 [Acidobacteria bacterium]|nr:hypothetical protein [Acidobacteriota bacterium]